MLLLLSDIKWSKNALNVKAKVQKMKLFINQSNPTIIKAVSGKHKIGLGILNQSETLKKIGLWSLKPAAGI